MAIYGLVPIFNRIVDAEHFDTSISFDSKRFKMVQGSRNDHGFVQRGGLVSSRVELYEAPLKSPTKRYNRADSFSTERNESRKDSTKPSDSSYVGSALIESGVLHDSRGEYQKALKAFNAALNTQMISLGNENTCVAHTLGNIGAVYLKEGNVRQAKEHLDEALDIKMQLFHKGFNREQIKFSDTLNNLGNVAYTQGDLATSLTYYQQALDDLDAKSGIKKEVADVLFNIGRVQMQQRQWNEALANLTESYKMCKSDQSEGSMLTVQALNMIGIVHLSTSSNDAAMRSFIEAHAIVTKVHGSIHTETAFAWYHIGLVWEESDEFKDAWDAYAKARDIFVRLGSSHDDIGVTTIRKSIARVERVIAKQNNVSRS